ncbi:putative Ig domain-containing protein [Streptomyces sp. NPDC003444]
MHAERWRKAVLAGAGAVLVVAGLGVSPAGAGVPAGAPAPVAGDGPVPAGLLAAVRRDLGLTPQEAVDRLAAEKRAYRTAGAVRAVLPGGKVTGMWFDAATDRLNVAVASEADARTARAAGADTRVVGRDRAALDAAVDRVGRIVGAGRAPGVVGWGADEASADVEVRVEAGRVAGVRAALRDLGSSVRVVAAERPRQQQGDVVGGEKWVPGSESPCSIGFSVSGSGGTKGFLTAGHCTNDANQPAYGKDGTRLGTSNQGGSHSVNASEGDFGLVGVDQAGWALSPKVSGHGGGDVTVTGAQDGVVGTSVCRSGQTSGWRCGKITKVNQTVDYGNVVIGGLSYTDACSAGGDSGGSYVTATGGKAVGLHSGGGSATCSGGSGERFTIFQPVNEALAKWGLSLVTSAPQPGTVTVAAVAGQSSVLGRSVSLPNSASGGTAPYSWSATGLPAGLSIGATTGTVSGTPTAAGSSSVTLTATDSAGASGSVSFTWTVTDASGTPPALAHPGSQTVRVGRAVVLPLSVTGGTAPYSWSATGLPAGLSIGATTGTVSGTPTTWGMTTSRVTVTDAAGRSASVAFGWSVFY